NNLLPPIDTAASPVNIWHVVGFVPVLLAAFFLPTPLVVLVGLASGLGRAGWQSHQVLEIFHLGLAAWFAAWMLRNRYKGRIFTAVRWPLFASTVALVTCLPLFSALAAYVYAPASASPLSVLDLSLSVFQAQLAVAILEGLSAGLIVQLFLWAGVLKPSWQTNPATLTTSPFDRTLRNRLLSRFILYSLLLALSLALAVFVSSLRVSRNLIIDQMANEAQTVIDRIPLFRNTRQNLLIEFQTDDTLTAVSPTTEATNTLRQIFRTGSFYRRLLLVERDANGELFIVSFFPSEINDEFALNKVEKDSIERALTLNAPVMSEATAVDGSRSSVAMVVPLNTNPGDPQRALVGRVNEVSLNDLLTGLDDTDGTKTGFIVDELGRVVAHPELDALLSTWQIPAEPERPLRGDNMREGIAYEGRDGLLNTRQLVYTIRAADPNWSVVVTTPYETVLGLALSTSVSIIVVLIIATAVFCIVLIILAQGITRPLNELVDASRRIAAGDYNTPIATTSDDEIGELGQAYEQMQKSLRRRMEELSLLLNISQSIAGSLNVSEGIPTVLQGSLRGTGALGARMVVISPSSGYPLTFGEGPMADRMSLYDRRVMALLRQNRELILHSVRDIQTALELSDADAAQLPFKALTAFALYSPNRFQGVFWLVFRRENSLDQTELDLLRTLAGQAAVLVENARLYATSEGGRRRLSAVLSSTTDAVIVTDSTDRILIINPAMERSFNLNASEARNRLVRDVIHNGELAAALSTSNSADGVNTLEVPLENGQTFFANASTIYTNDGQILGRVAVLHDITQMKELDEMKSNFVQMVSHDLRSPLTYMNGFMSMLPMVGDMNEKQIEYLDKIQRGIDQMNSLIKNLLDLGRLEAGLDLMRSPVRLDTMISGIADDLQPMAEESNIKLVVERPVKLPYLNLDNALVRQAITNLVTNAFKYAPDSPTIVIRADVKPGPTGENEVVISVTDKGPGIAPQDQIQLFEKFQRVKQRGNIKVKGSGLGLAIVKSVAERHGGRAWVTSAVGKGSTFYLSFPYEPVDFGSM
ncbi:MAG: HAMP domain-containing protein, partial [Anaerolineales bacterium]|nr:HAMP domain-containing protein [Anaerolineales bacterium]